MRLSLKSMLIPAAIALSIGVFANGMKDMWVHTHRPIAQNANVTKVLHHLGLQQLPAGYTGVALVDSIPDQTSVVLSSAQARVMIAITDIHNHNVDRQRVQTNIAVKHNTGRGGSCTHATDQKISTGYGEAVSNIATCVIAGRTVQEEIAALTRRGAGSGARMIVVRSMGEQTDDNAFREILRNLHPGAEVAARTASPN